MSKHKKPPGQLPRVELENGVCVANYNLQSELEFYDGSILPAVSEARLRWIRSRCQAAVGGILFTLTGAGVHSRRLLVEHDLAVDLCNACQDRTADFVLVTLSLASALNAHFELPPNLVLPYFGDDEMAVIDRFVNPVAIGSRPKMVLLNLNQIDDDDLASL